MRPEAIRRIEGEVKARTLPATGHMPFSGHRTQAEVRRQKGGQ